MPHSSQVPEPWRSFLGELDREATEEIRLDCMGRFVVTLLYGLSRATSDLDVLLIAPREQRAPLLELGVRGGALHRKYKIYLDYVAVASVPEDYEDRLTEMFPGAYKHLRPRSIRPGVIKARTQHPARSRRCKAPGSLHPTGLENPQGAELRWQLGNPEREDLTLRLWTEMIEEARGGTAAGRGKP